jgi:hypothetical protein
MVSTTTPFGLSLKFGEGCERNRILPRSKVAMRLSIAGRAAHNELRTVGRLNIKTKFSHPMPVAGRIYRIP